MSIDIKETGICIRPSSVDSFQACPYQWAKVFLEGNKSIPGARAAIGTAIHRGIEVMWTEAMVLNKKEPNLSMMLDASIDEYDEIDKEQELMYDKEENSDTSHLAITGGITAYIEDCMPFLDIPEAVESRFDVNISGHEIVASVGGTVDYIGNGVIDDVKTSKRKPIPSSYTTQQSLYKYLAEANGVKVHTNRIQGVVLTKTPKAMILEMETDVPKAKFLVNTILATITEAMKDLVPIELLFRCNTKHYLCSPKYCSFHGTSCPATNK